MTSAKAARRFSRRERRKAKAGHWKRAPKKPGVVGHGTSLGGTWRFGRAKYSYLGGRPYIEIRTQGGQAILIGIQVPKRSRKKVRGFPINSLPFWSDIKALFNNGGK